MKPMSQRHQETQARPAKAPRWVSPWTYDDEWEDEQRKHLKAAQSPAQNPVPSSPGGAAQRAPDQSMAPPPAVEARKAPAPTIVSLVQETPAPAVVDWVEIDEETLLETSRSTAAKTTPFSPPQAARAGESQHRGRTAAAPQVEGKPASSPPQHQKTSSATSFTAPQPQPLLERVGPKSDSTRQQAESSSSWGTLFITSLGLAGALLLGWIYFSDISAPLDDDLILLEPVDLAPKIAGPERLSTFLQAINSIPDLSVTLQPTWKWDMRTLESYVRGNGAALDALRDLLGDFDWHPRHAAWHQEDLGAHASWPHVRILLQARVVYLLALGNEESALLAATDIGRLSHHLQDMWSWPTYMQRSQELHMACVQMMAHVLKQTRLGSAELKLVQDEFMRCAPLDGHLQSALSAFYLHEKKLLLGEKSGAPLDTMPGGVLQERPGRLFFKKQETLSLFAENFRKLRDQVVITPVAAVEIGARVVRRPAASLSQFQPNGEGERYFKQRIEPCLELPARHHLAKARHDLVLSLFAIRRYLADQHKLPSGLGDLRPDYLQDIPLDPFSGEQLCYDPLKGVLFSVGSNLRAEGGSITEPPLADPDEPTVELGISASATVEATQKLMRE